LFGLTFPFNYRISFSIKHGEQRAVRRPTYRRTTDIQSAVPSTR